MANPITKKCLNCGYELQLKDESQLTPLSECPKCQAIYRNVERILAEKEKKKKLAEDIALDKKNQKEALKKYQEEALKKYKEKRIATPMSRNQAIFVFACILTVVITVAPNASSSNIFWILFLAGMIVIGVTTEKKKTANSSIKSNLNETNHTPKCPTCGSANIEKIPAAVKIFFLGPFAPLYKTFRCNNCKYKW